MINLQVVDTVSPGIDLANVERAAQEALQYARPAGEADMTLVLTDDPGIQQLNRDFLDIDAPTDVLSFPADLVDPDNDVDYLGDVIVSYPRAQEQAQAAGHSLEAELQILVVHGALHLLGYDHADPEEKNEMWALQGEILARLGLDPSQMP